MVETDHSRDGRTDRLTLECDWPEEARSVDDVEDIALPLRNAIKSLHKAQYKGNTEAYYDQAIAQIEIALWLARFNRFEYGTEF